MVWKLSFWQSISKAALLLALALLNNPKTQASEFVLLDERNPTNFVELETVDNLKAQAEVGERNSGNPGAVDELLEELLLEGQVGEAPIEDVDSSVSTDPEEDAESRSTEDNSDLEEELETPLQTVGDERVQARLTRFILDGSIYSHLSNWGVSSSVTSADESINDTGFSIFKKLDSSIKVGLTKDNILITDFNGIYTRLSTALRSREVETNIDVPVNLLGFRQRITITGDCGPLNLEGDECSFLPPLQFEGYDDSLIPTRLSLREDWVPLFGEVSPETLEFIKQPGFQQGLPGEELGLDILVPNAGSFEDTSRNRVASRFEETDNAVTFSLNHVRQVLKQNYQEAVLGRTIRGVNVISGDEDAALDTVIQLATASWLPDANPSIEGSDRPFNPRINDNLFKAANGVRLPVNSYTSYQVGVARAASISDELAANPNPAQAPEGRSHYLWMGLSPVINRSFEVTASGNTFKDVGSFTPIFSFEAEAGQANFGSNQPGLGGLENGVNNINNVEVIGNILGNTITDLQGAYVQIALDIGLTNATAINTTMYRELVNFVPHISFTGNVTDYHTNRRYYVGALFDYTGGESGQKINPYIGADYNFDNRQGLKASTGFIGYANPDRDYYSRVWGNVSQTFSGSRSSTKGPSQTSFTVALNVDYAIDQEESIDGLDDEIFIGSRGSKVTLSGAGRFGSLVAGVTHNFGNILKNSDESYTRLQIGTQLGEKVSLSGYYTPFDEGTDVDVYGVSLGFNLGGNNTDARISLGWNQKKYVFDSNDVLDNRYTITFSMGGNRS
ncbi:hypothetical protein NIES970_19060 [[Synechococcus] sp. NIES-970]|nr:hypothetical protein NIES970_19060 [[Synechococcus] sp. NIES-970]